MFRVLTLDPMFAQAQLARAANLGSPLLSKLESIASSAVRAADKVGASLIIVYTQSGAPFSIAEEALPKASGVLTSSPRCMDSWCASLTIPCMHFGAPLAAGHLRS